jgi:hypothetical protein
MDARVHQCEEIAMEVFLIVLIVVVSLLVCALGAFWFIREAQSRDSAKPLYVPRSNVAYHRWEDKAARTRDTF